MSCDRFIFFDVHDRRRYINVNEIATSNSIESRKVHASVIRLLLCACYCAYCWTCYSIYWTWNWLSSHDIYSRIRTDFEPWEVSRRSRVPWARVPWLLWSRACLGRRRVDLKNRRARFVNLRLSCSRSASEYPAGFLVLSTQTSANITSSTSQIQNRSQNVLTISNQVNARNALSMSRLSLMITINNANSYQRLYSLMSKDFDRDNKFLIYSNRSNLFFSSNSWISAKQIQIYFENNKESMSKIWNNTSKHEYIMHRIMSNLTLRKRIKRRKIAKITKTFSWTSSSRK